MGKPTLTEFIEHLIGREEIKLLPYQIDIIKNLDNRRKLTLVARSMGKTWIRKVLMEYKEYVKSQEM